MEARFFSEAARNAAFVSGLAPESLLAGHYAGLQRAAEAHERAGWAELAAHYSAVLMGAPRALQSVESIILAGGPVAKEGV